MKIQKVDQREKSLLLDRLVLFQVKMRVDGVSVEEKKVSKRNERNEESERLGDQRSLAHLLLLSEICPSSHETGTLKKWMIETDQTQMRFSSGFVLSLLLLLLILLVLESDQRA